MQTTSAMSLLQPAASALQKPCVTPKSILLTICLLIQHSWTLWCVASMLRGHQLFISIKNPAIDSDGSESAHFSVLRMEMVCNFFSTCA